MPALDIDQLLGADDFATLSVGPLSGSMQTYPYTGLSEAGAAAIILANLGRVGTPIDVTVDGSSDGGATWTELASASAVISTHTLLVDAPPDVIRVTLVGEAESVEVRLRPFRSGVSGGSQPQKPSNPALWFDASQLVGFAENDPVATWPDLSASGFDAGQGSIVVPPANEKITIGNGFSGSGAFSLSVVDGANPPVVVGPIPWNATAADVQALFDTSIFDVLATLGPLDTDPFEVRVEFVGASGHKPIAVTVVSDTLDPGPGSSFELQAGTPGSSTPAPVPMYGICSHNGLPVVRFDADEGQWLQLGPEALGLFRALTGFTVAVVVANIPLSDDYVFQAASATNDPDIRRIRVEPHSTSNFGQMGFSTSDDDDAANYGLENVVNNNYAPVASLLAVDLAMGVCSAMTSSGGGGGGGPCSTQSIASIASEAGVMPDTDSLAIYLGRDPSEGSFLSGEIAEVIVYQRALSFGERMRLLEYLSAKWSAF